MRAVLYLIAALAAAVYHLTSGSLFLGIALLVGAALYPVARWYVDRPTWTPRATGHRRAAAH